jgi:hypothetical protein
MSDLLASEATLEGYRVNSKPTKKSPPMKAGFESITYNQNWAILLYTSNIPMLERAILIDASLMHTAIKLSMDG